MLHSTKVEIIVDHYSGGDPRGHGNSRRGIDFEAGGHPQFPIVHPGDRLSVEVGIRVHGCRGGRGFLFHSRARLEFRAPTQFRHRSQYGSQLSLGSRPAPGDPQRHQGAVAADLARRDHAWWVPDFGAKRAAIPGFVNELWFKVDPGKEGLYRGQCAALCGRDHGFMPIVVDVRTPDDFKKWVGEQKAAIKQAALPAPAAPCRGGTSAHSVCFAELTQSLLRELSDYGPVPSEQHRAAPRSRP